MKNIEIFIKVAAYTQHGKMEQEGLAKAHKEMANTYSKANQQYPGMAAIKGSTAFGFLHELQARKQAYKSKQKGLENLKALIPGVGMGRKGQKALDSLK